MLFNVRFKIKSETTLDIARQKDKNGLLLSNFRAVEKVNHPVTNQSIKYYAFF